MSSQAETLINWSSPEYKHKKRSVDWFWGLGIVVVVGSVASIILNNGFFAVFIVISGGFLFYFATSEPDVLNIEIKEDGIAINKDFFRLDKIKGFDIHGDEGIGGLLILEIDRSFMPILALPIDNSVSLGMLEQTLSSSLERKEMEEPFTHVLMDKLGF